MIPIDPRHISGLEWQQESAFSHRYQLKSGDSTLGELAFPKALGTLAEARTTRGSWTFKRRGVFTTSIGARAAGQENDIATYSPQWTSHKGLMRLESGEEFVLRATNFWANEWHLSTAAGQPLLRYRNRGFLKHGAQVETEDAVRSRPDFELLLLFTWYILLLHDMDSSIAAAGG